MLQIGTLMGLQFQPNNNTFMKEIGRARLLEGGYGDNVHLEISETNASSYQAAMRIDSGSDYGELIFNIGGFDIATEQDPQIDAFDTEASAVSLTSVQHDKWYIFRIDNIDYDAKTYSAAIYHANGTEIARVSGLSFFEQPEANDKVRLETRSRVIQIDSIKANAPAPDEVKTLSNLSSSNTDSSSTSLSWSAENVDTTRVEYKPTDASSWTTFSTISGTTTTETVTGLLNGEAYDFRVVADSDSTIKSTTSATTTLPADDQPVLSTPAEGQITVDRETVTTNYGEVEVQYRETGVSTWTTHNTSRTTSRRSTSTTSPTKRSTRSASRLRPNTRRRAGRTQSRRQR